MSVDPQLLVEDGLEDLVEHPAPAAEAVELWQRPASCKCERGLPLADDGGGEVRCILCGHAPAGGE